MKVRKRSIRNQIIWLFLLLIIVPLLFSEIYVYYTLQSNIKESYVRHQSQSMNVLALELKEWQQRYETLSFNIFGDRRVQNFLNADLEDKTAKNLSIKNEFNKAMHTYFEYSHYVKSVYVVDKNLKIYGNNINGTISNYILKRVEIADQYKGRPFWDNSLNDKSIVLFRQINDKYGDLKKKVGYVFIVLDSSELNATFNKFIMDDGQQFLLKNNYQNFEYNMDHISISKLNIKNKLFGSFRLGHKSYFFHQIKQDDWTLVTWIPEKEIFKPIYRLVFAIIFVMTSLFLFSMIMVYFISNRITKPLRLIQNSMKKMCGGFLGLTVPVVREDEIGDIATTLNNMSKEIVDLIARNREEETRLRLIQLQTLQYQINPHFLYNTLDSVNMLARKQNNRLIADIVTYLSRLLRIGLNQGREMLSISEEVNHVRYYLKIQEIRFGDKLQWKIVMDDDLKDVKIIKFLLQPLVENSILHGIRKRNQIGHILIKVTSDENSIIFMVEDDGVGMTNEEKEKVQYAFSNIDEDNNSQSGFGLRNVHQRVQLHYGKKYGILIESEFEKGTVVTIKLPRGS